MNKRDSVIFDGKLYKRVPTNEEDSNCMMCAFHGKNCDAILLLDDHEGTCHVSEKYDTEYFHFVEDFTTTEINF